MRAIIHNNFFELYLLVILLELISRNKTIQNKLKVANITLKIKGIGQRSILSNSFNIELYPKEVYINREKQGSINYSYNFNQTENIVELIWYNYITETVNMFYGCSDITEMDLSNFESSYVDNMGWMFRNCTSLTSINLSNFYTTSATKFNRLFQNCSSLTSVDLSKFDSSKVIWFHEMFEDCISLTSIDLSNFKSINAEKMRQMFKGCIKLEFINMKNFNGSNKLIEGEYFSIFERVPDNIVVCIEERNINNIIISQLNEKACYSIDCTENWRKNKKTIINETNGCTCEFNFCLSCQHIEPSQILCTKCDINLYPIENDASTKGEYHKCYQEPKGYYFDEGEKIYKKCYYSCNECKIKGSKSNHNCLECNSNYSYSINNNNNYFNCFENCNYYHYFDNELNYHCTSNNSCPNEYPTLILEKMECVKNDINNLINLIKNETNETKEIEYYDNILYKNTEYILSGNIDLSNIDKGNDEIIETDKMKITLTTTNNQKNNMNNNITTIDLGDCEFSLRAKYNLSNNISIYMRMIEVKQGGMKIPKIEYDIYYKISMNKLEKLNLSICENSQIIISIPVEISENIDKYNIKSGYYNNICYKSKSDKGIDIILKDRKNEFIENNLTLCQEDCDFSYYNFNIHKVNCSCKVKDSSSSFKNMKINKSKLLQNFVDIKNIANINILICYKSLFSKTGLLNNIGNYIISFVIILHIISIFIFYTNQLSKIKNKINFIIFETKIHMSNNNITKSIKARGEKRYKKNIEDGKTYLNSKQNKRRKKEICNILKNKIKNNRKFKKLKSKNVRKINYSKCFNSKSKNNYIMKVNASRKKTKTKIKQKSNKKNLNFDIDKINLMSYNMALIYDKRSFCQYYLSLLKTKHNLIFSFCYNADYNSQIIKIDSFFIGFTMFYAVNTLFFNDDTMHQIYENNGIFDFEYQLPITVYSSLISIILDSLLSFLALSNDEILSLKEIVGKEKIIKMGKKLKQTLKIKFFFYFIISFFLLLLFWYYISMFGAIYRNTQIHLLKDTLISFVLSLIYPFEYYLFPGFFRIPALSNPKKKRKCLYIISQILQKF